MHVAGAYLGPCIGDADNRLVQVVFCEAGAAQIRARGGAAGSLGQRNALALAFDGHLLSSFARCQLLAVSFQLVCVAVELRILAEFAFVLSYSCRKKRAKDGAPTFLADRKSTRLNSSHRCI